MQRNERDRDGTSYSMGLQAENGFVEAAKSKGWRVQDATSNQNRVEHWDYLISKNDKNFKVEVKAEKKASRWDNSTDAEWIWIEFVGITGHPGWIYGKADYIAFQVSGEFHLIKREVLVELVDSLVTGERVTKASDAKYKLYTRKDREDLLTRIKFSDIVNHCIKL